MNEERVSGRFGDSEAKLIKKTKVPCLVSFLFLEIKIEQQLLQSHEIY